MRLRQSNSTSLTESDDANEWKPRRTFQIERHRFRPNGTVPGSGEFSRYSALLPIAISKHARFIVGVSNNISTVAATSLSVVFKYPAT